MSKYGSLRFFIGASGFIGWAVIVFMVVGCAASFAFSPSIYAVLALVIGVVVGMSVMASGQVFQVLVDIEENTRKASEREFTTVRPVQAVTKGVLVDESVT